MPNTVYVSRLSDWSSDVFSSDLQNLEGFRARGSEVLLLTDPIDEFWVQTVGLYDGYALECPVPRRLMAVAAVGRKITRRREGVDWIRIGRASRGDRVCQYVILPVFAV